MLILRAFLALLAGFASMAVLVAAATALLMKFVPEWVGTLGQPRAGYIFVNLGYSFTAAMVGGYVTCLVAVQNPLIHVLALALIVLLLSALSALQLKGQQPVWYQLILMVLTPAGVMAGGYIHLRLAGLL